MGLAIVRVERAEGGRSVERVVEPVTRLVRVRVSVSVRVIGQAGLSPEPRAPPLALTLALTLPPYP